jgi:hypothetical protein
VPPDGLSAAASAERFARRLICNFRFKFCPAPPMKPLSTCTPEVTEARDVESHANRRSAANRRQPSLPGPTLVEVDAPSTLQLVGVSAVWRKLLVQAEMAAPHVQTRAIEGECGAEKTTLARYLFSRSPSRRPVFSSAMRGNGWRAMQTRRRRPVSPISIGSTCSLPRPGTVAGRVEGPAGPAAGPGGAACSLGDSAAADGRPGPADARSGLPAYGNPFRHFSICASAVRIYRPARPGSARSHLPAVSTTAYRAGPLGAGPPSAAQLARQCARAVERA